MRRFGTPPKDGIRYKLRPGVYAILIRGDDLLCTFQEEPWPEFQLPGGGIDPGENPLPALFREVMEETGYTIAQPQRLGAFRRFTYMPEYDLWAEKVCTIYLAQPAHRIGPPTEAGHHAIWMPATEAASRLAVSGDRYFLNRVLA